MMFVFMIFKLCFSLWTNVFSCVFDQGPWSTGPGDGPHRGRAAGVLGWLRLHRHRQFQRRLAWMLEHVWSKNVSPWAEGREHFCSNVFSGQCLFQNCFSITLHPFFQDGILWVPWCQAALTINCLFVLLQATTKRASSLCSSWPAL